MIRKVNEGEAALKQTRKSKSRRDIEEFLNSDWEMCEVDISNYSDLISAYASYVRMAKEYSGIRIMRRNGHLFLLRT